MSDRTLPASPLAIEARDNFLAHYKNGTLALYEGDLRIFFDWCAAAGIDPLQVRRSTLERFVNDEMNVRGNTARSACRRFQTVRSYFRLAAADEIIDRDPTWMVRLPKWEVNRDEIDWLDRYEMGRLLQAAEATSPAQHLLVGLMGILGLRVSEACSIRLEHLTEHEMGYTVFTVLRKGGRWREIPFPVPMLRMVNAARGDRATGPLVTTKRGNAQTRNGAHVWMKRLVQIAELPATVHCHTLRHSAITEMVNSGASMQEVQEFADHRDIRSTEWYYHRKASLDQHGGHTLARNFMGAANLRLAPGLPMAA